MFKRHLLQDNALLYAISSRTPKVSWLSVQRYAPVLLHTVNYSTSADAELYWKLPLILNNRLPTLYLSNIVCMLGFCLTKPSKDFQQDSFFFFLSNLKKCRRFWKGALPDLHGFWSWIKLFHCYSLYSLQPPTLLTKKQRGGLLKI